MTQIHPITAQLLLIIDAEGYSLLKRFPDDVLVHDNAVIGQYGEADLHLAWCVGHSHSHLYPVAMHDHHSSMIRSVSNLCREDSYYEIKRTNGNVKIERLTREQFTRLAELPSKFTQRGGNLEGSVLKNGVAISSYHNVIEVSDATISADVLFQPRRALRVDEKIACQEIATFCISEEVGTLFFRVNEFAWKPVVQH